MEKIVTESLELMPGCKIVETKKGNIMFGCPSEIMKVLQREGVEFPQIIVLPEKFFDKGVIQAAPELMKHMIFKVLKPYQSGEHLKIVGKKSQIEKMRAILKLKIFGPSRKQRSEWDVLKRVGRMFQKINIFFTPMVKKRGNTHYSEGNELKHKATLNDLVEFYEFIENSAEIDNMVIGSLGENRFHISFGNIGCEVNISINEPQIPPAAIRIPLNPISRSVFGATTMSTCASGSSAINYRSGIIIWVNGLALAVDGVAWMDEHLENVGVNKSEIAAYVLTHVHDDQAHLLKLIRNKVKFTLITSRVIYKSFVFLASNYLSMNEDLIERHIVFREAKPGQEMDWYGSRISFWYTVHPVPTIGFRISINGKSIVVGGDTAWGSKLIQMMKQRVVSKQLCRQTQALPGLESDLTFFDAGSGGIHARPYELATLPNQVKKHLVLTQVDNLPKDLVGQFQKADTGKHWDLIPQTGMDVSDLIGIEHAPFLMKLNTQWYSVLVSQSRSRTFSRGEVIISHGEPGDKYYIILSGSLSLRVGNREIVSLSKGDFLSDTIISSDSTLNAKCTAATPVRSLEIPKHIFAELVRVSKIGKEFMYVYEAKPTLVSLAIFEKFSQKLLQSSFDTVEVIEYPKGEVIASRGDGSNIYYGILSGEVEIRMGSGNNQRLITTLKQKHIAKERIFRTSGKHATNFVVTKDARVAYLSDYQIEDFQFMSPGVFFEFGVVSKKPK